MKKHNKSKRGVALATTVLMMFIILLLCSYSMTLALYNANIAKLTTSMFEHKLEIDQLGQRFIDCANDPINGGVYETVFSSFASTLTTIDPGYQRLGNEITNEHNNLRIVCGTSGATFFMEVHNLIGEGISSDTYLVLSLEPAMPSGFAVAQWKYNY